MAHILQSAFQEASLPYRLQWLSEKELVALGDLCFSLSCLPHPFIDAQSMDKRTHLIFHECLKRAKAQPSSIPLLTIMLPRMAQFGMLSADRDFYLLVAAYISQVGRITRPDWDAEFAAVFLHMVSFLNLPCESLWASHKLQLWRSSAELNGWQAESLSYRQLRYRMALLPNTKSFPRIESRIRLLEQGKSPRQILHESWSAFQLMPALGPKVSDIHQLASSFLASANIDNARRWQVYYACANASIHDPKTETLHLSNI